MLASTLGLDFDPEAAWDQRKRSRTQQPHHRQHVIAAAAACGPAGHWTCVSPPRCSCFPDVAADGAFRPPDDFPLGRREPGGSRLRGVLTGIQTRRPRAWASDRRRTPPGSTRVRRPLPATPRPVHHGTAAWQASRTGSIDTTTDAVQAVSAPRRAPAAPWAVRPRLNGTSPGRSPGVGRTAPATAPATSRQGESRGAAGRLDDMPSSARRPTMWPSAESSRSGGRSKAGEARPSATASQPATQPGFARAPPRRAQAQRRQPQAGMRTRTVVAGEDERGYGRSRHGADAHPIGSARAPRGAAA